MRPGKFTWALVLSLLGPLAWIGGARTEDTGAKTSGDKGASGYNAELQQKRGHADRRVRPKVEEQRQQAEQQAAKTLDKDAQVAIEQTEEAIKAICNKQPKEALAAIERATGKINVLLARNPGAALIPVAAEVDVIDEAPADLKSIRELVSKAQKAVYQHDFPTSRILLDRLMSEIRVRTYSLPLATYPDALKEAARLVDKRQEKEASLVLLTAMHTLVIVDRITPLPLVEAEAAIEDAQELRDKKKDEARELLATAKTELERAKELGYSSQDPAYEELDETIARLNKELKGNEDTTSTFSKLKEKVVALFSRQSPSERR